QLTRRSRIGRFQEGSQLGERVDPGLGELRFDQTERRIVIVSKQPEQSVFLRNHRRNLCMSPATRQSFA
ncbi:MAG TPA: hypothetical protein VGO90_11635, partial [Chthoniobacteraceae bacterium]|nr:hypothetical protein [Chthoniobacteraceae bacterium]